MMKSLLCVLGIVMIASSAATRAAQTDSYIVLNYHDIPEHGTKVRPFDRTAVSRQNFEGHLDWLAANGYHFISIQQIIDAHAGKIALPDKAVLLTFDDGFASFYTRVFPILRQRHIPAVEAVIGTWMRRTEMPDVPGNKPVLTWPQVRELQASGLVEIASHTDTMHNEIDADPQGETHASITTRQFLNAGRYESDAEYASRLATGMQRSADFITVATGRHPRVLVWPFGEYNGLAVAAARRAGMPITLALSDGGNNARADLSVINRLMLTDDPEVPAFAAMVTSLRADRPQRAISIDFDTIWNANPVVTARNEAAMIRRVRASGASAVYLQAYADHRGAATAMYFPNRHMPVRADLLSAMTEQLKEETGAKVYALMPARVVGTTPAATRWAGDIYEDLAKYVAIDGLVLAPEHLRYPHSPRHCPDQSLADASAALTARMRIYRPFIKTAVNIEAPVMPPVREAHWLDRAIPRYLRRYDYVVVDAEGRNRAPSQLARLVSDVELGTGSVDHVVFGLKIPSVRSPRIGQADLLNADLAALLRSGARNIDLQPETHGLHGARVSRLFGARAVE